ncbi:uncharacterized protein [Porites lutea]|uniref:uncharacterized protein n=1 Tax=Porites lutea TaxID=51062 RepID=UPI003CC676B0
MRKRSESQREKRKDFSSAQHLVGFSGKVLRRKLKPLRRSRSDKIREAALEQEYLDKCNNLSRCLKNHGNLLDVISQLRCCDGQNFCDSSLCQELQERYNNNISLIKFLLGNVGTTIDVLPNQIQVSLSGILHKDKKLRNKLEKVGFWFGELKGKMKGKVSNFSPSTAALLPRKKTPLVIKQPMQPLRTGMSVCDLK